MNGEQFAGKVHTLFYHCNLITSVSLSDISFSKLLTAQTNLVNAYHAKGNTKTVTNSQNLLPMTTTLVVFPPNYPVDNMHFNDAKPGNEYSLKPKHVEILQDDFEDEADFKSNATYQDYCDKHTISCILFEMVKDEKRVHHTGVSKEDTEEACKQKIKEERHMRRPRGLLLVRLLRVARYLPLLRRVEVRDIFWLAYFYY